MSENKVPEFEPPQACVSRIIKNVLPDNVQITKDARAAFTRAAGIFIFYLTNCANEFSREGKRQTITTADVMNSLKELDFEEFEQPLVEFLEKYRKEIAEGKKNSKSKKQAATDADDDAEGDGDDGGDDNEKMNTTDDMNADDDGDDNEEEDQGGGKNEEDKDDNDTHDDNTDGHSDE